MPAANATTRGVVTTTGLGLGLALGCLVARPNENHCSYLDGDRTCAERYPGDRTFCRTCGHAPARDGCVAEQPDDACYSPCGAGTRLHDDASCLAGSTGSEGDASTTGETPTTGSTLLTSGTGTSSDSTTGTLPCTSNDECTDEAEPFCETASGECVACDEMAEPDAACAALDPTAPLCVGGGCVHCTAAASEACTGNTPVCDERTNTCVPCTRHDQCGGGACELAVGTCFAAGVLVHVDGNPGAMPPADYTSIDAAVSAPGVGEHRVVVVHELQGGASYLGTVTINGGKTIALLAAPGEAPIVQGTGGGPGLRVQGAGTTLYVDGLRVAGNTGGRGLEVEEALAWMDRSHIVQNSGGGVLASSTAELVLRNSFVGGANNAAAVDIEGSTARIDFSTLGGDTISATGLSCTSPDSVEVRNSIIVALGIDATGGFDVACSLADITFTATEAPFVGMGNVALGELSLMTPNEWFVGYAVGDFHLNDDGLTLFADVAQWQAGDPPTDIDGDPRPTLDGTPDFAGADVP